MVAHEHDKQMSRTLHITATVELPDDVDTSAVLSTWMLKTGGRFQCYSDVSRDAPLYGGRCNRLVVSVGSSALAESEQEAKR